MSQTQIAYYICSILCFIPAIICHEVMHGYAAYRLGDPTAKNAGRLSLNPIKHIDPFGTIILPLILMVMNGPIFGYAKPVPYNPSYFKNKRRGDLIVGLAGPLANLLLAFLGAIVAWILYPAAQSGLLANTFFNYFYLLFLPYFTLINLYLMFFNLLPVPPLDGSSIFAFILPERFLPKYYQIEHYAMPVLLIILFVLPYICNVDIIGVYLNFTAGGFANLIFPFTVVGS
jgi:Zn-dependent protease